MAISAWVCSLLGCAVVYLALFANGMSAAPRRMSYVGIFTLAVLPFAGLLLTALGIHRALSAGSALTGLLVYGVPLLSALAAFYALAVEAVQLWRCGRPLPPPERLLYTPNGSPPRYGFALCRARSESLDGWRQMTGERLQAAVWVEDKALLGNADLVQSWAVGPVEGGGYAIGLRFSQAALDRVAATALGGQLAIVIDDALLLAPRLIGELRLSLQLNAVFERAEAIRIARGIVQN